MRKKVLLPIIAIGALVVTGTALAVYFYPSPTKNIHLSYNSDLGIWEGGGGTSDKVWVQYPEANTHYLLVPSGSNAYSDGELSSLRMKAGDSGSWSTGPWGTQTFLTDGDGTHVPVYVLIQCADEAGCGEIDLYQDAYPWGGDPGEGDVLKASVLIHGSSDF